MARSKKDCPECTTHTIQFTPANTAKIYDTQGKYLSKGKRKSVEQIVNILIAQAPVTP